MKIWLLRLSSAAFLAASALMAQSGPNSSSLLSFDAQAADSSADRPSDRTAPPHSFKPFTRYAIGAGISPLGVNLMVATNIGRNFNLRGTGNLFQYTVNNITTNGFNVDAKLNLASAGASLDIYPFARHGLRFSPGVLFYNQNSADTTFTVKGGTTFTLNSVQFIASSTNPVTGVGSLGLHTQSPAFTATTGWGNVIPRSGGHWSFPFEVGVAFIGSPALNIALNSGQVCNAQGQVCIDVATDQVLQANLQTQIAKYKNDLDPLKTYPIVSFGIAYSFGAR